MSTDSDDLDVDKYPEYSFDTSNNFIFISHSKYQSQLARDLKKWLRSKDFKVFIYEDDIPAGANIVEAVSNAIYRSRRCLLIVSPEFLTSDYFVTEYTWAMDHQSRVGVVSCLPILYQMDVDDLPIEFRHISCLKYEETEDFHLKLLKFIEDDTPIATQIGVTHTGVGLAWSYYYGYLEIILPGLKERVESSTEFKIPVYPKLVVILPVSCRCPDVMPTEENFRHIGFVNFEKSRAANRKRCYKSTVYEFRFTDRTQRQVHCHLLMEFATPLLSLYQMNEGSIAQLSRADMVSERHKFKEVITQILSKSAMRSCHGRYLLVDYRDEDQTTSSHQWKKESLSQVVARTVENDMIASGVSDKYLCPVQPPPPADNPSRTTIKRVLKFLRSALSFLWLRLIRRNYSDVGD